MIAALVPGDRVPLLTKVGIMMLMYGLGTGGAFGFAWLFKRTLLKGAPSMMIMELPPYHLPRLKDVVFHMAERAWIFVRNAGTVILAISIVLWFLSAYPRAPQGATAQEQLAHSFAGEAGRTIEPLIKPLGFDWRVGIGLISSFAAREVFVSSTAVVFSVENIGEGKDMNVAPLRAALRDARWPDGRALFTPLVCLCLMVYYVFAMQCMSTVAVVWRETNSLRWPLFQIIYMTGTAWVVTFLVYQVGRALGF
jgi:ferrous iron transport protein B